MSFELTVAQVQNWFEQVWSAGLGPAARRPVGAPVPAAVAEVEPRRMLSATAGTWTHLANPSGGGTMMLLTDGTVMMQGGGVSANWSKLTPDANGHFINGTISSLASMSVSRLYTGSNVLPNGKVYVIGGEYSGAGGFNNTAEIYDPVSNTWSAAKTFVRSAFGDDPTVVLADGRILCGFVGGAETYLYDPKTDTWTQTGSKLRNDSSDEETWILQADGSVLTVDVFNNGHAQRYVPSSGQWVDAGTVPVTLTGSAQGFEMGPATLLPDGRIFQMGANQNSAIYDPKTNTWVAGPSLPAGMGADDAPGAMLPDGHFVFLADKVLFNAPAKMYDFDYTTNTLSEVTLPSALANELAGQPSFVSRMLLLPDGHLLLSAGGDLWDYAPSGTPKTAWRPTINTVTLSRPATATVPAQFTLSGTQLTGISEGASYGDDAEMSTNYPIVRIVDNTGKTFYARTTDWTPSVAQGSTVQTVKFTVPLGFNITSGFRVQVIANGISSSATDKGGFLYSQGAGKMVVNYIAQTNTLLITSDAGSKNLTISKVNGVVTLTSLSGTINDSSQTTLALPQIVGKFNLSLLMNAGNDQVKLSGLSLGTVNANLGDGNDGLTLQNTSIDRLLLDGGTGTNTLTKQSGVTIGSQSLTNITTVTNSPTIAGSVVVQTPAAPSTVVIAAAAPPANPVTPNRRSRTNNSTNPAPSVSQEPLGGAA